MLAAQARAALAVTSVPDAGRAVSRRRLLLGAVGAAVLGGGAATAAVLATRSGPRPSPVAAAPAPQSPAPSAAFAGPTVLPERALGIRSTEMFPFLPGKSGETPVAAIVDMNHEIHVRDLVSDTDIGSPLKYSVLAYTCLADIDGSTAVVRSTGKGTIETTDLRTGLAVGTPIDAHQGAYVEGIVSGTLEGRPIAATVAADRTLRRWDLTTRTQIGTPIPLQGEGSRAGLGLITIGGRLTVHIHVGSTVFLYEFVSGTLVPHADHIGHDIIEIDGVAVVVDPYGTDVRVRDMVTGAERTIIKGGSGRVVDFALTTIDRRPVVAMSWADNTIAIRDLATGSPLGRPLAGHEATITSLGVTDLRGTPILLSAAEDNSIRVWDLAARAAG